ncbi:hypothetical protein NQT62_06585 [Limnobacter humi]|uniref:YbjN domain-containing protein n=1 Tax=Limnobacter humi TaxID=1778671 RepID=A0ABT1WF02_9BURK|nr:hypothetical protein [Limnobacter humi]MCQ8896102.1 hypothetical protein [Limnobacter humi]
MASSSSGSTASPTPLPNGFLPDDADLLHQALRAAGLEWFDGEGMVLGRCKGQEVYFRPGQSAQQRWVVLGVPLYNMNMPNAAELCLHFLAESFDMVHVLDFHFQVGINMHTEMLEFLIQLPLDQVSPVEFGELVKHFVDSLTTTIQAEVEHILENLQQAS